MLSVSINRRALKHIIDGSKKYEIRQKKGIFEHISANDCIKLFNGKEFTIKKVNNTIEADTLDELFTKIDFHNCTPYFKNKYEAIKHIHKFYSKSSISCKKFIAINLL